MTGMLDLEFAERLRAIEDLLTQALADVAIMNPEGGCADWLDRFTGPRAAEEARGAEEVGDFKTATFLRLLLLAQQKREILPPL